jgi:hypothetical protein
MNYETDKKIEAMEPQQKEPAHKIAEKAPSSDDGGGDGD